nr:DoxX family protein [Ruania zhangjianzhongii]
MVTIAVNAAGALASFTGARFITDTLTEIKVQPRWLPVLASLQAAGALGLLLGLLGLPAIGLAAATGLVLYFLGAVITHLRAGAHRSLASPLLFLALAVTTLALAIVR